MLGGIREQLRPALLALVLLAVLTGIIYPLVVTGLASVFLPREANGSMIFQDGKPVGSALIGQSFDTPKYFWGRPSATAPMPYNGAISSGSNVGPANPALVEAVKARIAALRAADPGNRDPIPVDLVTASASGLDPDISPAAAEYQVKRVARARGIREERVRDLAARYTQPCQLGILGEPRVNVLQLNLALDAAAPARERAADGGSRYHAAR